MIGGEGNKQALKDLCPALVLSQREAVEQEEELVVVRFQVKKDVEVGVLEEVSAEKESHLGIVSSIAES